MTENSSSWKEKSGTRRSTAFYIETLLMAAVFTVVILVLTRVFALSRQRSREARLLTCAVHLAENAAEAVSASGSAGILYELLDEGGNARLVQGIPDRSDTCHAAELPFSWEDYYLIEAWYDSGMNPAREGDFRVRIAWFPQAAEGQEAGEPSGLFQSLITVYWRDESVYHLEMTGYRREAP